MKQEAPTIQDLIKHIQESETVKAAITESVHRFYYDKCFNPRTERPYDTPDTKLISRLHTYLSCKYAGWRYRIKKHFSRYQGEFEDVKRLPVDSMPK